jgi:hypothetical protein
MANTYQNTLNKVGNLIEDILGTNVDNTNTHIRNKNGQTCLEKIGIEARAEHIIRNEWRKNDIEYTRALVLAEYAVQNEFKISSSDEPVVRNRGELETLAEQYERRSQAWKAENNSYNKKKEEEEEYLKTHTKEQLKEKKRIEKQNAKEAAKAQKLQEKVDKQQTKLDEAKSRLEQFNERTRKEKK